MASFILIPFRGAKIIQSKLLKEALGKIEIEYELKTILLSFDGASILFRDGKIKFINNIC